jgi:hypothetical protein
MISGQSHQSRSPKCSVCSHDHVFISSNQLILGKYRTDLISCARCGHEWFNAPETWLSEAYALPIADTDTGIVTRTLDVHRIISSFLSITGHSVKILDWGSGSGLLTRLLRDDGYDCYGLEPYTQPVLAGGHTCKNEQEALSHGPFRAVVAIEVVEHLVDPQRFFKTALLNTDTLIFSTELVDKCRHGNDWWYYSRETGQHISFYTEKSLAYLAQLNSCKYVSSRNKGLHIITRRSAEFRLFRLLAGSTRARITYPLAQALGKFKGRRSLVMADYLTAKQALCNAQSMRSQ